MLKAKMTCLTCGLKVDLEDKKGYQAPAYAHAHNKKHHVIIMAEMRYDYPFDLDQADVELVATNDKEATA